MIIGRTGEVDHDYREGRTGEVAMIIGRAGQVR